MAFSRASVPETPEQVRDLSRHLEHQPLGEVLRWCWERFGTRAAVGTSFQGAGVVILHQAHEAGYRFPVFTLDTGFLFPETVELWRALETRFGIAIEGLRPDLTPAEQDAQLGPELWKTRPDLCCQVRKVEPLQARLQTLDVWITGVRRQQADTREGAQLLELYQLDPLPDAYVFKFNPLAAWTRPEVQAYLAAHDLPQNTLLSRGYRSIGCTHCTRPVSEGENERAGRWTGFDKTECGIHTFLRTVN